MTAGEIAAQIWRNLGEPSDLDPYTGTAVDFTTAGGTILLRWINESYKRIVSWKFENGRQVRFASLESEAYFETALLSGTAGVVNTASTNSVTLNSVGFTVSAEDDFYNGWVIEVTGGTGSGQYRIIVDYSGASQTATLHKDWTTNPDATSTVELYKDFMEFVASTSSKVQYNISLDPSQVLLASLKLSNLDSGSDLSYAERRESFASAYDAPSDDPGSYYTFGNKIFFDSPVNANVWFKLECMKIPTALAAIGDVPNIPAQWHWALVLATTWIGQMENGETGEAYATYRSLETFMARTKEESDMAFERADGQVEVVL
jgi:hypothetical protein